MQDVVDRRLRQIDHSISQAQFCRSLWERDEATKSAKKPYEVHDAFYAHESVVNGDCLYHSVVINIGLYNMLDTYVQQEFGACNALRTGLIAFIRSKLEAGRPTGPEPDRTTSYAEWRDYHARMEAADQFYPSGGSFRFLFSIGGPLQEAFQKYIGLAAAKGWPPIRPQSSDAELIEAYLMQAAEPKSYANTPEVALLPFFIQRPMCLYNAIGPNKLIGVMLFFWHKFKQEHPTDDPTAAQIYNMIMGKLSGYIANVAAQTGSEPDNAALLSHLGVDRRLVLKQVQNEMEGTGETLAEKQRTSRRWRLGITTGSGSWKFTMGRLYGAPYQQFANFESGTGILPVAYRPLLLLHGGDGRDGMKMDHFRPIVPKTLATEAQSVSSAPNSANLRPTPLGLAPAPRRRGTAAPAPPRPVP